MARSPRSNCELFCTLTSQKLLFCYDYFFNKDVDSMISCKLYPDICLPITIYLSTPTTYLNQGQKIVSQNNEFLKNEIYKWEKIIKSTRFDYNSSIRFLGHFSDKLTGVNLSESYEMQIQLATKYLNLAIEYINQAKISFLNGDYISAQKKLNDAINMHKSALSSYSKANMIYDQTIENSEKAIKALKDLADGALNIANALVPEAKNFVELYILARDISMPILETILRGIKWPNNFTEEKKIEIAKALSKYSIAKFTEIALMEAKANGMFSLNTKMSDILNDLSSSPIIKMMVIPKVSEELFKFGIDKFIGDKIAEDTASIFLNNIDDYINKIGGKKNLNKYQLRIDSISPTAIDTSSAPYDAQITLRGKNFTNVMQVSYSWSGVVNGSAVWNRGDQKWTERVRVMSDDTMVIMPRVVEANPGWSGMLRWTVTLRDTSGNSATQSFTVNYSPKTGRGD